MRQIDSNRVNDALREIECSSDDSQVTIFQPHSGTTDDNTIMKIVGGTTSQNVLFSDGDDPYMYSVDSRMDATRTLQDSGNDELGSFFSRPLKIAELEWATNTSLNFAVDPWAAFLNNPRVGNRMSNFNLLRARMHLKILINGNSFHYGRAMALYHPQHTRDDFTTLGSATSLVQGSQMPHVFLNPTTSTGGDLALPFFWEKNNVNLPSADYVNLGRLHIISLNDLKHANGADDKATITMFAWMENVELNMLTSLDMPLTPQSGVEVDEANNKGTISGPATTVAKIASTMSETPIIGPYAMATSRVAGMTAQVAKLMGYSRPNVTKNPEPYRPAFTSNLATTTVPDSSIKMTVDDKQELTVDPTISGIGPGDPMNIKQIAMRESYLTTFNWNIGVSPESLLFNTRVMPTLWATEGSAIYLPAAAMAALPFKYWTGTMRFRFQIVASGFHKGRLKFVYDPNFMSSNEYNTNFVEIVDISEKQDFTIEVGIGQDKSLLTSALANGNPLPHYGVVPVGLSALGNGVLSVYVVNELTTPNTASPQDIAVNLFVSMGDDFEVFVPDKRFQSYVFKPQSGFEPQSGEEGSSNALAAIPEDSAPQNSTSELLGNGFTNHDELNKVFVGETIKSFRPLLKRFSLHSNLNAASTDAVQGVLYGRRAAFPYLRGNVANAINTTSTAATYNYCNTLLIHWVTLAFSGYRGSIRWKILPEGNPIDAVRPNVQVERTISTRHYANAQSTTFLSGNLDQAQYQACLDPSFTLPTGNRPLSGAEGLVVSNGQVNPGIEFEVPYYSQERFVPGKLESYTGDFQSKELNVFDYRIFVYLTGVGQYYNAYTATGEDFQTYFWTGLPPLYYEPGPPSPAAP